MSFRNHIWRCTIYGQPITKKNSQRIVINSKTKHPMILPSKQYKDYEKNAGHYIRPPEEPIARPVNVRCVYYMSNTRACDLTNLMEATHDILVKHKVLADDNHRVIYAVDGSRVSYDKLTPRTEVFIEEIDDECSE